MLIFNQTKGLFYSVHVRALFLSDFAKKGAMLLNTVVERLEGFANLKLACGWDNVGLLVEPSQPHRVRLAICTIDLTPDVMREAIGKRADLIISYHPPIFTSFKSITQSHWKQKIVTKALENRIAIYSPHTCLDVVKGGVNDWLLACFGDEKCKPIVPASAVKPTEGSGLLKVIVTIDQDKSTIASGVEKAIANFHGLISFEAEDRPDRICYKVELSSAQGALAEFLNIFSEKQRQLVKFEAYKEEKLPLIGFGEGRLLRLENTLKISDVIGKIKKHLQLQHVRVALPMKLSLDHEISTIAACAGSGGSVLKGTKADIYLTGEMSHHDILDAVANGVTVILCEHSNTERGYLQTYALKVKELCEHQIDVIVSDTDKDPLQIV